MLTRQTQVELLAQEFSIYTHIIDKIDSIAPNPPSSLAVTTLKTDFKDSFLNNDGPSVLFKIFGFQNLLSALQKDHCHSGTQTMFLMFFSPSPLSVKHLGFSLQFSPIAYIIKPTFREAIKHLNNFQYDSR